MKEQQSNMNLSKEREVFEIQCYIPGTKLSELANLPSDRVPVNYILVISVNIILIISAIILNVVPIITIWRSSQLRSKPCYFIILIQSVIDLAVAVLGIPVFVAFLILSVVEGTFNCLLTTLTLKASVLSIGLSILTSVAMTAERYIAILHPYAYLTLVTKKRLLIFVCSTSAIHFTITALPAEFSNGHVRIYPAVIALFALTFIAFAYTRIYLVVRRLARSENRPHDATSGGNVRRMMFLQEIKQAKSCFIVVVSFFTLGFLPTLATQAVFQSLGQFKSVAIFTWIVTLAFSMSIVDSVIFFWTKTMLRKEAAKILSAMCSRQNI